MLPIHKVATLRELNAKGELIVSKDLKISMVKKLSFTQQNIDGFETRTHDKMLADFWDISYGDLRSPLSELMLLARRAAKSNPAAYPDAARIDELIGELEVLLDWRKQLAAKQTSETNRA